MLEATVLPGHRNLARQEADPLHQTFRLHRLVIAPVAHAQMFLQLLHRKVGTEEGRQVFLHPVLEDDTEHFITDPGGIGFRSDVVQHQNLRLLHGINLFVDRVALDRLLHLHREGRIMHQCRQMAAHCQFMRNRTQADKISLLRKARRNTTLGDALSDSH